MILAAMETLDGCMEAVEIAAECEVTNGSEDSDIFRIRITTCKLLFGGSDGLSARMTEVVFVTVAAEFDFKITVAVVSVILDGFSLVWTIDNDSRRVLE